MTQDRAGLAATVQRCLAAPLCRADGSSSQERPSTRRPATRRPRRTILWPNPSSGAGAHSPHCLNRKGSPAATQPSRSPRTQSGSDGRAPGPISPPPTTQSSGRHAGPGDRIILRTPTRRADSSRPKKRVDITLADWNLDAVGGNGFGWQSILAGIGILMSIVMQSSSAAAATTLVALHAGSLTFDQACAMIVGQSVGTAATSALVAIGAGLAVRRAALAHIIYNVGVGILGILLLRPMTAAAGWVGSQLDDPQGVLALAAFSSIFKFVGVAAFFPWLDSFSRLIVRISGKGAEVCRRPSRVNPRRGGRRCSA